MPVDPLTHPVANGSLFKEAPRETVQQSVKAAVTAKIKASRLTSGSKEKIIKEVFKKQDWNYTPAWLNIPGRILKYFRRKEVSQLTKEVLSQQKLNLLPTVATKVRTLAGKSFQEIKKELMDDSAFNIFKPQELDLLSRIKDVPEGQFDPSQFKTWKHFKTAIRTYKFEDQRLEAFYKMPKKVVEQATNFYSGKSNKSPDKETTKNLMAAYLTLKSNPEMLVLMPKAHRKLIEAMNAFNKMNMDINRHMLVGTQHFIPLKNQNASDLKNLDSEIAGYNLGDETQIHLNGKTIPHSDKNQIDSEIDEFVRVSIPERVQPGHDANSNADRKKLLQAMIWQDYRPPLASLAGALAGIDPSLQLQTSTLSKVEVSKLPLGHFRATYTYKSVVMKDNKQVGTVDFVFHRDLRHNGTNWESSTNLGVDTTLELTPVRN